MQAHAAAPLPEGDRLPPASVPDGPRRLRMLSVRDGMIVCIDDEARATDGHTPPQVRFTLPIDERLRTAVRGGAAESGEDEMAPALRPREIQSRIRAGASVEQVAAAAGCPVERIEGFAYPVLLERATIAERGCAARPLPDDSRSLSEIVTETLADRGQGDDIAWDAFKDERGWTIVATWQAGRTDNRAEWAFTPRTTGGTLAARGAEAEDLMYPGAASLRSVGRAGGDATRAGGGGDAAQATSRAPAAVPFTTERRGADGDRPRGAASGDRGAASDSRDVATDVSARPGSGRGLFADPQRHEAGASVIHSGSAAHGGADTRGASAETAEADPGRDRSQEPGRHHEPAGRGGTSRRGHKPQMPSWEDVLLGTRTTDR